MAEVDDEDERECDCCRFPNPVGGLTEFASDRMPSENRPPKRLCELCAKTLAGVWYEYPEQHDGDMVELLRAQNHIGNRLRRDLADWFQRTVRITAP
jgi:hypothetical protein